MHGLHCTGPPSRSRVWEHILPGQRLVPQKSNHFCPVPEISVTAKNFRFRYCSIIIVAAFRRGSNVLSAIKKGTKCRKKA